MARRVCCILLSLFLLCTLCSCADSPGELAVSFLKVGKADAILLKTEGSTVLIDTGEQGDGAEIVEFLTEAGVDHIDLMVITHFDKDHVGGAEYVIRHMNIGMIYAPDHFKESEEVRNYESALSAKDYLPITLEEDVTLTLDGVDYTLYAAHGEQYANESNDRSIVVRAVYGDTRFLFCGDIEEDRILELTGQGIDLSCDVLKVPHHGRYNDALPELFSACAPRVAVITCSDKNPEQEETVAALTAAGARIFLTREGDVHLISDGHSVGVYG